MIKIRTLSIEQLEQFAALTGCNIHIESGELFVSSFDARTNDVFCVRSKIDIESDQSLYSEVISELVKRIREIELEVKKLQELAHD